MGEPADRNPFVGPSPFDRTESDRKRFFGRDLEAEEIVSLILGHPVVLVYAQSGAGKTSLFNAKVIPTLEEEYKFEVPRLARVKGVIAEALKAGEMANLYVYNALRSLAPEADPRSLVQKTLVTFLQERPRGYDQQNKPFPRALIFDQFEEIFALYPEGWQKQQETFFQQVRQALDSDPLLRVVLIIREDYLPQLDTFAQLVPEGLRIRFRLERLKRDQALEAVVSPLITSGYKFGDRVAESLIEELAKIRTVGPTGEGWVEGPYVEPVQLQVVCMRLWSSRRPATHVISLEDVRKFDVNRALADFYEDCIRDAANAHGVTEFQLRTWFGETLITSMGTRGTVFKERESAGGLPNPAAEFLERQHLIRTEYRSGASWYELAHDRFIEPIQESNQEWIAGRQEAIHAGQRLEQNVAEWVRLGRGQGGLLDEVELLEADRWLADPIFKELGYSAELQALVQASRGQIEKTREEKEAAQQRELEHVRALEAVQRKLAERHAETARRFRMYTWVLGGVAAMLLLTAVYAWVQVQIAFLRKVVATSINNLDIDPELSILLAVHAAVRSGELRNQFRLSHLLPGGPAAELVANEAADALGRAISASHIRLTLRSEAKESVRVVYSRDGKRLATNGRDNTVMIWNAETGEDMQDGSTGRQPLRVLAGHTGPILDVAFASQGNVLATASSDNKTVQLWHVGSETKSLSLKHADEEVVSVKFSADGEILATADSHGFLRLWDVTTGTRTRGLEGSEHKWVTHLSFSPDKKYLATASQDRTVAVWTISTGKERFGRLKHDDKVLSVKFSPDGKLLATTSMDLDRTVRIWDAETGKVLRTVSGHTNTVFDVAFSPDGNRIATASADATVRLYDTVSGRYLFTLAGHRSPVESLAFSPDNKHLATASWDGTVRVWDVYGHTDVIHSVAFSEDGRRLATASADGTTPVWDSDTGNVLLRGRIHKITAIALSHNADRIATGNKFGELKIWDAYGKIMHTRNGHRDQISAIAFNRHGDRLATAGMDSKAVLWNVETGDQLGAIEHEYELTSLAFDPNGLRLATADEAGIVKVWDIATGQSHELGRHARQVFNMVFSADGKRLASASEDGSARLWDLASKDGASRKLDHAGPVFDVHFSPNGTHLVTVSEDGTAKVWEVASGDRPPITLRGHTNSVESVAFSFDGMRLATASRDGTARVWDAASGKELIKLTHSREVRGVVFSPDGTRLTTSSADGKVRVHFFDIEKLKKLARERITRTLTGEECAVYLGQDRCPSSIYSQ